MEKLELIYEGKAKQVYATENPLLCIAHYKDDATAFNGEKRGTILGKGAVNNRMTNHLMKLLNEYGIPTHFVRQLSDRETLLKKAEIIPLEVIIRNIAAGSMAARYGVAEGTELLCPSIEFSYKSDTLGDPLIGDYQAIALGFATRADIELVTAYAFKINEILKDYLLGAGILLVDFKLEFGKMPDGEMLLADEISPDTCRFWDSKTGERLDKDRFRRDLGGVEDAYNEMAKRLLI